jgi:hypothetical protein
VINTFVLIIINKLNYENFCFRNGSNCLRIYFSCKGEKEKKQKTIDSYTVYVDSKYVPVEDAKANWQSIEATYELKSSKWK